MEKELNELLGGIDIYLLDQIVKGRFEKVKRVLDVGCRSGRNIEYLSKHGVDVFGIDIVEEYIKDIRLKFSNVPKQNFIVSGADNIPFDSDMFDAVICSAVLHFAKDDDHFNAMVNEMWRVLSPGGIFFVRLASSIGIEELIELLGNNCYKLPDGTVRHLVDEQRLISLTDMLGGELVEPIKTTNVQNLRCMTTWVVKKPIRI